MPQLDIIGYVGQIIWLIGMFMTLYLMLVGTGLPRLYKILSYRKNKLVNLREDVLLFEKEKYLLENSTKVWLLNVIKCIKSLNDQLNKKVDNHLEIVNTIKEKNLVTDRNVTISNLVPENWNVDKYVIEKVDSIDIIEKGGLKRKIYKG